MACTSVWGPCPRVCQPGCSITVRPADRAIWARLVRYILPLFLVSRCVMARLAKDDQKSPHNTGHDQSERGGTYPFEYARYDKGPDQVEQEYSRQRRREHPEVASVLVCATLPPSSPVPVHDRRPGT